MASRLCFFGDIFGLPGHARVGTKTTSPSAEHSKTTRLPLADGLPAAGVGFFPHLLLLLGPSYICF